MKFDVLKFNGKQSDDPELGIELWQAWRRPIAAGTRDRLVVIDGRNGVIDHGGDLQELEIECEFVVAADSMEDLRSKARAIAAWLHTWEPAELLFGDEQDKYYNARRVGSIDQEQIINTGEGSVTFMIPEGCAFAKDLKEKAYSWPQTNEGTLQCPAVVTFEAPHEMDKVVLRLAGTDKAIILDKTVAAGAEVVIDTGLWTVTVAGEDERKNIAFHSYWFWLPVGDFTLELADQEEGGEISPVDFNLQYRERYI